MNNLPQAGFSDPPDGCLPSSQDYRREPPAPDLARMYLIVILLSLLF
jgi:hypothetical protein